MSICNNQELLDINLLRVGVGSIGEKTQGTERKARFSVITNLPRITRNFADVKEAELSVMGGLISQSRVSKERGHRLSISAPSQV